MYESKALELYRVHYAVVKARVALPSNTIKRRDMEWNVYVSLMKNSYLE